MKLVLTAADEEERNRLMGEIRLRVAPWELLHKRARELMADVSDELSLEELARRMNALLVGEVSLHHLADIRREANSSEMAGSVPNGSSRASVLQDRMEKFDWLKSSTATSAISRNHRESHEKAYAGWWW